MAMPRDARGDSEGLYVDSGTFLDPKEKSHCVKD